MISNHLSLVEALRPASDELAAAVDQYLAAGGKIEVAEPYHYKPKPITYSNQMPPTPKPFVRRKVEANPLPLDKTDIRSQDRLKMAEQIRQLGVTLTQTEVAAELGVSRRLIYNYAARYDMTFKPPTRGGARNLVRKEVDEARDAKYAERIRAFLELGITRRQ
ncbi:helix-turn-helix transcriptional regulator [Pseudomonas canadensis]|uniref:helix-turn-helix transcriptional regulator n=1 Tax=Pseudomonas canadensis TaxID=915099 RepID=UPI003BA2D2D0